MYLKAFLSVILTCLIVSCSSDEKTSGLIGGEVDSGAFVRTLGFNNSDVIQGDPTSTFSVNLEVQDEEDGGLLDNLEVFAKFKDNTPANGNLTSQEFLVKTISSGSFITGPIGLPRFTLELTLSELLSATSISNDATLCKDQFLIRLKLNLTDGRSFSVDAGSSSTIIGFDTLFSSPFCYSVTLVDPLGDQFIGMYRYSSIIDGPIGPTFGQPKVVEIKRGSSVNSRTFEANYIVSRLNEPARTFNFLVACDELIFGKNQISSFFSWCRPEGGFSFGGPPILLGPDTQNSMVNYDDDSTFELQFVEGYLGWDGDCDFGTTPVRILFTKQ